VRCPLPGFVFGPPDDLLALEPGVADFVVEPEDLVGFPFFLPAVEPFPFDPLLLEPLPVEPFPVEPFPFEPLPFAPFPFEPLLAEPPEVDFFPGFGSDLPLPVVLVGPVTVVGLPGLPGLPAVAVDGLVG
jgi:hypothetical protein